jgi:putative transposase
MPRRPRTHLDGLPLHIVQRGHNRDACFLYEADYLAYLNWLDEALRITACQLHAYVLMTNHVHLLLTPEKADAVPQLLISLGRRYVQYFNRTYRRTGTLWDSRYKSSLIQADTYLLAGMRYIELNPVRAGMVNDPADYRWSSYRANGLGQDDLKLTPHPVYLEIAQGASERQAAYRHFFRPQLDDQAIADLRLALNQSLPLGNSHFHQQIALAVGELRAARPRGRPRASGKDSNDGTQQQLDWLSD